MRYVLGLLLVLYSCAAAGGYAQMNLRIAREFHIPESELLQFSNWVDQKVLECDAKRMDSHAASLNCIRKAIYQDRISIADSTSSIAELFPSGGITSLSLAALILSERLGLRATPVMLPETMYLRFSSGQNWDPLDSGKAFSDDLYRRRNRLDPGVGRSAKPISEQQYEGWLRFQIANVLGVNGDLEKAKQQFLSAQKLWDDPRIPLNLASLLEKQGQPAEGLHLLDSLWNWGARSEELAWNKAMLMVRLEKGGAVVFQFVEDALGRRVESERLVHLRNLLGKALASE